MVRRWLTRWGPCFSTISPATSTRRWGVADRKGQSRRRLGVHELELVLAERAPADESLNCRRLVSAAPAASGFARRAWISRKRGSSYSAHHLQREGHADERRG